MFHMLSCFHLRDDVDLVRFQTDFRLFFDEMRAKDMVESVGSLGRRQSDTPMDTDEDRDHGYFIIMSFRDREQVDAAYAYIEDHQKPRELTHTSVLAQVRDPVFICWQDLETAAL